MKIFIAIISGLFLAIQGQGQTILNINWELNEEEKMEISYDLIQELGTAKQYNISFFAEINGRAIQPRRSSYRGDAGPFIETGRGKKIIWDIKADYPYLKGDLKIKLKVASVDSNTPIIRYSPSQNDAPSVDWWGYISTSTTGLGLIYLGYQSEKEARDLYQTYKTIRNPEEVVYQQSSRTQVYNQVVSKHRKGVYLMAAGGTIMAVGTTFLIHRILKNKQSRLSVNPVFSQVYDRSSGSPQSKAGLSVRYRF